MTADATPQAHRARNRRGYPHDGPARCSPILVDESPRSQRARVSERGRRRLAAYHGAVSLRKDDERRGSVCRRTTNASRVARAMRAESLLGGGRSAIEQQHARGKLTARERLELLLDPGSFVELDAFVTHRATDVRSREATLPRRRRRHRPRIDRRAPGVRLQPGLHGLRRLAVRGLRREDLQGDGPGDEGRRADHRPQRLRRRADPGGRRRRSAATPTSSCATPWRRASCRRSRSILGPCAGGAVYSPAITDFTVMVEGTSYMFVTGPNVVKAVTHEDVDAERLGGATTHTTRSGVAHLAAHDEATALDAARRLLAYLPQNNLADPPRGRARRSGRPARRGARHDRPGRPDHAVRHARGHPTDRRRRRVPRDPAGLGAEHHRRLRAPRRPKRRHRRATAGRARGRARHRRIDEGGALRPNL